MLSNNHIRRLGIVSGFALAMFLSAPTQGGFLLVYGGPTYNSSTGNGYSYTHFNPNLPSHVFDPSVGSGIGVGYSTLKSSGTSLGHRAVRWNSLGNAAELGNFGTDGNGTTNTQAWAVNGSDVVVGSATMYVAGSNKGTRATRWDAAGTATEMPNLGTNINGVAQSEAFGINASGVSVGYSTKLAGADRAVRWNAAGTAVTELGALNNILESEAYAVNDSGVAVGRQAFTGFIGSRAVRWNAAGAVTELGNLGLDNSGSTTAIAYVINSAGTAGGFAAKNQGINFDGYRAVRWDASGTSAAELDNLGVDSNGDTDSRVYAINAAGVTVGVADKFIGGGSKGERAVRWSATGTAVTELGNIGTDPTGSTFSAAYAINDSGIAVGYNLKYDPAIHDFSRSDAIMWGTDGLAIDLNDLIDPNSGWVLNSATAITNTNWISGRGTFDPDGAGPLQSYQRLFIIQIPEPYTVNLLLVGSAMFIRKKRKSAESRNGL